MNQPGKTPPGNVRAPQSALWPRLAGLLSVVFGAGSLIAFTVFLFMGPWHVLPLFHGTAAVLAFDAGLSAAFFAQHSGMIRRTFKAWFARCIPEYVHGAYYSIAAGICLFGVVSLWQPSGLMLLSAQGYARFTLQGLFLLALTGIAWSNLALRSIDAFGLRSISARLHGETPPADELGERGPYRWVRHPQYLCILVMIWSHPDLSADRLLFNLLWSAWVVAGTVLEERDLAATHGARYRDYQSRVPMLLPCRIPRKTGV